MKMNNQKIFTALWEPVWNGAKVPFLINTVFGAAAILIFPIMVKQIVEVAMEGNIYRSLAVIFFYCLMMFLAQAVITFNAKKHYTGFNAKRRKYALSIYRRVMGLPAYRFESAKEMQKVYDAFDAVLNNDNGIEGIFHTLFDFGRKILSILLLSAYIIYVRWEIFLSFCLEQ